MADRRYKALRQTVVPVRGRGMVVFNKEGDLETLPEDIGERLVRRGRLEATEEVVEAKVVGTVAKRQAARTARRAAKPKADAAPRRTRATAAVETDAPVD